MSTADSPARPTASGPGVVEGGPSPVAVAPVDLALGGVAVALVVVAGIGALPVELLGPDVLLAVAGFRVTAALLGGAGDTGRLPLARFYRDQLLHRAPLLMLVLAAVLGLVALLGEPRQAAQAGLDAATVVGANWWDLATTVPSWQAAVDSGLDRLGLAALFGGAFDGGDFYVERPGRIDPLGVLWLVAVLVQLAVLWPLVLAPLRRVIGSGGRPRRLAPALAAVAVGAALIGPLRAMGGAAPAELALGTHVRLAEWLFGATAAAVIAAGSTPSRRTGQALTAVAAVLLGAAAVLAVLRPLDWLRLGGPQVAALGTAVALLALHPPRAGRLAAALGRGLPLELGRAAYPLLVLHLPVIWLVQVAVPDARPFALLVVGAALAWLLGLLLYDGLLRRTARRRTATVVGVAVLAVGVAAGASSLVGAAHQPGGDGPVVLVLGGSQAGGLAAAMSPAHTVVDASLAGCGLLPAQAAPAGVRSSRTAQLPVAPAPVCGSWTRRWSAAIGDTAPAAIVVDLSVDAVSGSCDPAFRARYRALLDDAVTVWTAGAPQRPVLLVDGRVSTREGRCLRALLVEAVAARSAVVALDVQALLCPQEGAVPVTNCAGGPPLDDERRATVARVVDAALDSELGPERTAAREQQRARDCGRTGDAGVGGTGFSTAGAGGTDARC